MPTNNVLGGPQSLDKECRKFLEDLRMNGFCVIDNVIPDKQCAAIRDSVSATVEREHVNYLPPAGVRFVPSIINHDQSFAHHLADKRLLGVVRAVLGEHPRISFTSAIINMPGNARGKWHADWPFNQNNAGHVAAPYPDALFHITTLWMLSPFDAENGGTLVVPGSHRASTNPTSPSCLHDAEAPYPTELHAGGAAGSVLVFDSRLWHATAPNRSNTSRVALAVRYAPWWLNVEILRPESDLRRQMVAEAGGNENTVPSIDRQVYEVLPAVVKPLYRHWLELRPE